MKDVFVTDFTFSLGDRRYSVEESAANHRTFSQAIVLKDAGFKTHYVSDPQTTAYDLAKRACEKIRPNLKNVSAIIYSTCLPSNGNIGKLENFQNTRDVKHLMDFPASHLQCDFQMDNAWVIGLNQQACTGMLGSLLLANSLIQSEGAQRILCLTADRFPESAVYEQSYNLISDGAAACIVSTEPLGYRLIACHGITNGAMAFASDDETVGSYFNYTNRVIQEILTKARMTIKDIHWIVSQNMNIKAWQILARLLHFDIERVCFPTLAEIGHLISGDNILNLKHASEENKIQKGERALLVMAGYGLNWHATILERV